MRSIVLPGLFLLSVVGCASDDPSQGGFFGGLVGLETGAYEERVTDKTASWKADDRRYQEELAAGGKLDGAVREKRYLAADLKQEAVALEGNLAALNAEIEALEAQEKVTSDDLAAAESKVASLIADVDDLQAAQDSQRQASALGAARTQSDEVISSAELFELRAQVDQLNRALDDFRHNQGP